MAIFGVTSGGMWILDVAPLCRFVLVSVGLNIAQNCCSIVVNRCQ